MSIDGIKGVGDVGDAQRRCDGKRQAIVEGNRDRHRTCSIS
jgi:hypothetical protein